MKQDGVNLSRRKTGGGAVYHDLGNTCFSFFTPYAKDDKLDYRSVNNQIIIDALKGLGIQGEVSGRNDLISEGKKVSMHLCSSLALPIGFISGISLEKDVKLSTMVLLCSMLIWEHSRNILIPIKRNLKAKELIV